MASGTVDAVQDLPWVTPDLPGTGGAVRVSASTFVVEEIPLYQPSGEGEHVYLTVRREDLTTREVQRRLGQSFGVPERDVGCAGQKDKVARVTQTFSLPLPTADLEEAAARAASGTGLEVLASGRHRNKLGRGHLAGNRFDVLVADVAPPALERARAILSVLEARGIANFFGEQRTGPGGRAARRGRRRLEGGRSSFIGRMELSAWQASLFNSWLVERMRLGLLDRVVAGDLARKEDTGGLFEVQDEPAEQARCLRREISPTGPIYGSRMRWAEGSAGEIERRVFAAAGVEPEALSRARLPGSRRPARVFPRDASAEVDAQGIRVRFRLPKGAYATVVLREITKARG